MSHPQPRPFDCPLTGQRCLRSDCKRTLCIEEQHEAQRERQRLDAVASSEIREFDRRVETEIERIAKERVIAETRGWGRYIKRKMVTFDGRRMTFEQAITLYIKQHRSELEAEARKEVHKEAEGWAKLYRTGNKGIVEL